MVEWAAVIAAGVIAGIVLNLYMHWIVEGLGEKISMRYPVVEVLSVVIFVLVFLKSGFGLQMFIVAAVFSLFLVLSVVDYYFHAIPDSMSLGLLTVSFVAGGLWESLEAGLIVAGFMILLRYYVSYFTQKEAMGEADVIIAAAMGAMVGIKLALFSLFIASFIGIPFVLLAKNANKQVPFVPFLSLGILLVYLFDHSVEVNLSSIGL
ncbi:MAG: prepilin peptidase [Campylobacterales bacterium]|nr:prepilin peptidase [Campylobacterales bacterium]HEO98172.1 prepilin peptidase [Campylobacterota bacterium]